MSKNVKNDFYNKECYYETRNIFASNENKTNNQKIIYQFDINKNEMWRKINNINEEENGDTIKINNITIVSDDKSNINLGCKKCGLGKIYNIYFYSWTLFLSML